MAIRHDCAPQVRLAVPRQDGDHIEREAAASAARRDAPPPPSAPSPPVAAWGGAASAECRPRRTSGGEEPPQRVEHVGRLAVLAPLAVGARLAALGGVVDGDPRHIDRVPPPAERREGVGATRLIGLAHEDDGLREARRGEHLRLARLGDGESLGEEEEEEVGARDVTVVLAAAEILDLDEERQSSCIAKRQFAMSEHAASCGHAWHRKRCHPDAASAGSASWYL